MQSDLFYFDVIYGNKTTFACQNEGTAIEWVKSIEIAIEYARLMEQQLKQFLE